MHANACDWMKNEELREWCLMPKSVRCMVNIFYLVFVASPNKAYKLCYRCSIGRTCTTIRERTKFCRTLLEWKLNSRLQSAIHELLMSFTASLAAVVFIISQ